MKVRNIVLAILYSCCIILNRITIMKKLLLAILPLIAVSYSYAQSTFPTDGSNVGIGTLKPQNALHVVGGITSTDGGPIYSATPSLNLFYDIANDRSTIYSFQPTVAWKSLLFGASTFSFISFGTNQGLFQDAFGNVGIGTVNPDSRLAVKGTIHATEIKVDQSVPTPDYVFDKDYDLVSLKYVKSYIDQNHHLPEMPSAEQVAKDGINLGEMNAKLLKKIEELTLYLIEKDKEISKLRTDVSKIKRQMQSKPRS